MNRLSHVMIDEATRQLNNGDTVRTVAKNLHISLRAVIQIRNANKENIPTHKSGPPTKIPDSTTQLLARKFNTGEIRTLKDGQRLVQSVDHVLVDPRTVSRAMRKRGVKAYVKQKKPDLTPKQKAERLKWAKEHKNWTVDQWKQVMFSDESTISRMSSSGKEFYYSDLEHKRFQDHQVKRTKQHGGGKLMVWGCITYYGAGDLAWSPDLFNSDYYLTVLQDEVIASRDWYNMDPATFIFQHDNSSVHTAGKVKKFLDENNITVLPWPANSPDLSPIENVWHYLKWKLNQYETPPKDMDELWKRLEDEWVTIPLEYFQKLYKSMPRRVAECIRLKGGRTRY